ncbi:fimbrial protein [Erwinia sp. CPCC 100877]|nr:fimbrial protein [Erwinia sp. CPCC 100877]
MLRIITILLCALFTSPGTWAACARTSGQPTTLTIPSQIMTISADAPISTSEPFAQFDSPVAGTDIIFNPCTPGIEYGKRPLGLSGQDSSTRIYQTNLAGIGIKLLYSNGAAFGNFPSTSSLTFPGGEKTGSVTIPGLSYYRIQFFKTGELHLSNPQTGDTILPGGDIAYNYMFTADPSSYTLKLNIGDMKIISTPACTVDGPKTVDFNNVTPTLLKSNVTRDLNFAIVCKSDYGIYSAKASMTTTTPSSDASYIRVKDAAGNMDRLGIRITDGSNQPIKVDGTSSESLNSIASQGPADFAWQATLIPGKTPNPAGGTFTAKAEIVFDIQ